MPAAVPLIAAAAGSAISSAVAGAVGGALLGKLIGAAAGFVVSSAINQLGSRATAKKQSAGSSFSEQASGQTLNVRSSIESHKLIYGQTRTGGATTLFETTNTGRSAAGASADNKFLHMTIVLAAHEVEEISTIYFNDEPVTLDADGFVTSAPYNLNGTKTALVRKHLGATDQVADEFMVSDIQGWTEEHRARGRAYIYVRLEYYKDAYPLGLPTITALVKGKKVYDPRTGLTAWSDNVALCTRDYLVSYCGVASDRIDDDYTIAAANVCDEDVTLRSGATQNRYSANGLADLDDTRLSILTSLTASMAGTVIRVGNKVRIHAGAYETPSFVIDDDMLAGDIAIRGSTPRTELINTVRGTYIDPDKRYQPTDFPTVSSSAFIEEDNGIVYDKDLQLPFTNHPEAAQRIAKLIMYKARQGKTMEVPLNHRALEMACWDTVTYTQPYLGFDSEVFRVKKFSMASLPNSAIVVQLQEESAASYAWAASEAADIVEVPETNLPSPTTVAAPGNPSVNEELYETRGSAGVKSKAIVTWGASSDSFLRDYQVEYRLTTDTEYTVAGRTDVLRFEIPDINPGRYVFRVKAFNQLGVSSSYATGEPQELYGLLAVPADVTGLTMQAISSLAVLRWDLHPDLDVRGGGKIHIRHSEALTGASWEESYSIGEAVAGNGNIAVLPLKIGTYLVKAQDTSGQFSDAAATVSTKNATVLTFSTISTVQEDTVFGGVHSNTFVEGGVLKLGGSGLFDDILDFDDVDNLDYNGGVATSGTYSFSAGIDLTTVKKVRLDTNLAVQAVNIQDLVDSRANNIDDWLDFDGLTGGGSVDAYIEVRETDDNPSGSPTWSDWKRLYTADYEARAFQFRLQMESSDPVYTIYVTELGVTAKEIA